MHIGEKEIVVLSRKIEESAIKNREILGYIPITKELEIFMRQIAYIVDITTYQEADAHPVQKQGGMPTKQGTLSYPEGEVCTEDEDSIEEGCLRQQPEGVRVLPIRLLQVWGEVQERSPRRRGPPKEEDR